VGFSGERFEETRLAAALEQICRSGAQAQSILEQLFGRLDRFVGADRSLEDDASMVVLKVDEAVSLPPLA
jgi:sigma-B regulation protein RsbU (phosphoserine phosphatase)